jgi:DNA-binding NtrC family response regulator
MLDGTQVLVVEDEPIAAMDIAGIIEDAQGQVVGPAGTVAEARRIIRSRAVDVALLDINLADGEVTPILEALRAHGVPTIVYTGGELPARMRERHPELKVLQKPALPARLVGEIRRAREVGQRRLPIMDA